MAPSTRLLLLTGYVVLSSALSVRHDSENSHEFPVLQLDRRNATGVFGNLTTNGTVAYPLTCNFTQEYTLKVMLGDDAVLEQTLTGCETGYQGKLQCLH